MKHKGFGGVTRGDLGPNVKGEPFTDNLTQRLKLRSLQARLYKRVAFINFKFVHLRKFG